MKYFFYSLGILIFLTSCAPTTTTYSDFTQKNLGYYKYTSSARSFSQSWIANFYATDSSQYEANRLAVNDCNARTKKRDCFVEKEGKTNVWDKNVAHLKAKEEKEKKEKELARKKKKEEAELAILEEKKGTCKTMGFNDETEGMANCILQLTLQENKNQTASSSSSSDAAMVDLMDEQNRIMKRQLRQQKLQNFREQQKIYQKMIDGTCSFC